MFALKTAEKKAQKDDQVGKSLEQRLAETERFEETVLSKETLKHNTVCNSKCFKNCHLSCSLEFATKSE